MLGFFEDIFNLSTRRTKLQEHLCFSAYNRSVCNHFIRFSGYKSFIFPSEWRWTFVFKWKFKEEKLSCEKWVDAQFFGIKVFPEMSEMHFYYHQIKSDEILITI